MKNLYNVDQIQKEAVKHRNKQEEADNVILEEAAKIEQMNYQKAKQARQNLEKAIDTQKETTQTIRAQGEKIFKAKQSAVRAHQNAIAANDLAVELHENRSAWAFNCGCLTGIKQWCARERNPTDIDALLNKNQEEISSTEEVSVEEYNPNGEEYVKGEHQTNAELNKILHGLKRINKEADVQTKLATQQKSDLESIAQANEYTQRQVEKTNQRLNKDLQE